MCPSLGVPLHLPGSGGAHVDGAQGCRENSEPGQDPSFGHGGEGEAGNQHPEAMPTSAYRQIARDYRHAQRHLHGDGEQGDTGCTH